MIWVRILLIAAALPLVASCAAPRQTWVRTAAEWASQVRYDRDAYKGSETWAAPRYGSSPHNFVQIMASRRLGQDRVVRFIQIDAHMPEWKFLEAVADDAGRRYAVVSSDRQVEGCARFGCSLVERISIVVPEDVLAAAATSGWAAKAWGARGEVQVYVPPEYVRGFLDRLAQ